MTFEDFIDLTAEGDLTLVDFDSKQKTFVFEGRFKDRIHMRQLPTPFGETVTPWVILVDGERVEFKNPAEIVSVNTIITGLLAKEVHKLAEEGKTNKPTNDK